MKSYHNLKLSQYYVLQWLIATSQKIYTCYKEIFCLKKKEYKYISFLKKQKKTTTKTNAFIIKQNRSFESQVILKIYNFEYNGCKAVIKSITKQYRAKAARTRFSLFTKTLKYRCCPNTAEKCTFSEGNFSKISSCFLTIFEKVEQKKYRGYLRQVFCKDYLSTSCLRFYEK